MAKKSNDSLIVPPHQAVELASVGQGGEGWTKVTTGIAIETALTGKPVPMAEDRQSYHLTARQRTPGAGDPLWEPLVMAKIIRHNIKCGQEGVDVHHRAASRFGRFEANYGSSAPFLLE
jgi:hypothetical protein